MKATDPEEYIEGTDDEENDKEDYKFMTDGFEAGDHKRNKQ